MELINQKNNTALTKHDNVPLKALDPKKLDEFLLTEFKYFLCKLLNITEDREEGVNSALEAIIYHCWGMGLGEVRKAFEMYANGFLDLEPRSNYLDYVLVGKIISAYKKQKPKKKTANIIEKVYSDEEKENIIYCGLINCYDSWFQYGRIDDAYLWVHDYLMEKKILDFPYNIKLKLWKQAEKNILNKSKDQGYNEYKKLISQMQRKDNTSQEIEYMYLRLQEFFKQIKEQNKHIKDFI